MNGMTQRLIKNIAAGKTHVFSMQLPSVAVVGEVRENNKSSILNLQNRNLSLPGRLQLAQILILERLIEWVIAVLGIKTNQASVELTIQ